MHMHINSVTEVPPNVHTMNICIFVFDCMGVNISKQYIIYCI